MSCAGFGAWPPARLTSASSPPRPPGLASQHVQELQPNEATVGSYAKFCSLGKTLLNETTSYVAPLVRLPCSGDRWAPPPPRACPEASHVGSAQQHARAGALPPLHPADNPAPASTNHPPPTPLFQPSNPHPAQITPTAMPFHAWSPSATHPPLLHPTPTRSYGIPWNMSTCSFDDFSGYADAADAVLTARGIDLTKYKFRWGWGGGGGWMGVGEGVCVCV